MQPNDIFKNIIKNLSPFLKSKGYIRKSNMFYKQQDKNWGVIFFQKSRKSTGSEVLFTINLGIFSQLLTEFITKNPIANPPAIEKCHWIRRIGELLPSSSDKWWNINLETPIEPLMYEIQTSLGIATEEMDNYLSDKQLLSLWLSGRSPGITELQRCMYLSIFLKMLGDDKQLKIVLQQLQKISQGKPSAFLVKQHLSNF